MAKDKMIKVRASEYDKALIKELAATVTKNNSIYDPTESDMVRMALSEMARKYLSTDQLNELRLKYMQKSE